MKIKFLLSRDYKINIMNGFYKEFKCPYPSDNHSFFSFMDFLINLYGIGLCIFDEDLGCEFIVDELFELVQEDELEDFTYNYYTGLRVSDDYLNEDNISRIIDLLNSNTEQVLEDFRGAFSKLFDSTRLLCKKVYNINTHNSIELEDYLGCDYKCTKISSKAIINLLLEINELKDLGRNSILEMSIKFEDHKRPYKFFVSYNSDKLEFYSKKYNKLWTNDLTFIVVLLLMGISSKSDKDWKIIENNYKNYIKINLI